MSNIDDLQTMLVVELVRQRDLLMKSCMQHIEGKCCTNPYFPNCKVTTCAECKFTIECTVANCHLINIGGKK